jgi:hypothetical protein
MTPRRAEVYEAAWHSKGLAARVLNAGHAIAQIIEPNG